MVDFGCAECKLQKYLRDVVTVEEVSSVDIDGELLQRSKHKISPQTSDYVFKRYRILTFVQEMGIMKQNNLDYYCMYFGAFIILLMVKTHMAFRLNPIHLVVAKT